MFQILLHPEQSHGIQLSDILLFLSSHRTRTSVPIWTRASRSTLQHRWSSQFICLTLLSICCNSKKSKRNPRESRWLSERWQSGCIEPMLSWVGETKIQIDFTSIEVDERNHTTAFKTVTFLPRNKIFPRFNKLLQLLFSSSLAAQLAVLPLIGF